MTDQELHPLAADYLKQLRRASRILPGSESRELCADIETHLLETTATTSAPDDVLNVLNRLGDPSSIVDAQQSPRNAQHGRSYIYEMWAIFLLLFGGFLFGLGWIVGVGMLWRSTVWTVREKWLGTLLVPGGFALAPVAALITSTSQNCIMHDGTTHCTGGSGAGSTILELALIALTVVGPILTAVCLGRSLRSARASMVL